MTASVSNVYDVLDCVKQEVDTICKQECITLACMAIAKTAG
jgi:hypothetical protein